ncbi:arginine--tRNA ligase [Methylacidimicrobium tartarophylax]|uniref:Arginine--tRNA ligase n=1 Tax=Methylacidimicrobium tartarophylax TaxID=1041768 RepID=A0A5E6MFK8_9BACT|nr:arginine--tRNA ligase [Methylacidimicrobium tartarophylax]VVM06633.1 arginyl-tRNA synthetase [Methylacidimicrobium tartarophylax]
MQFPAEFLREKLICALAGRFEPPLPEPLLEPCADPRFGDLQSSAALVLGRRYSLDPRALAGEMAASVGETDWSLPPEVAGPGFLNFRLKSERCVGAFLSLAGDPRLGIERTKEPQTVVVDYSSPNIAKEMHVGHLRSTILGESLARVYRFFGHRVVTVNHLGDWGTQFGMVLLGFKRRREETRLEDRPLEYLEELYQRIQTAAKEDPGIRQEAKAELWKLQNGDAENLALWHRFVEASKVELTRIYEELGVHFEFTLGESAYREELPSVVRDLRAAGIAQSSQGAVCVFFPEDPELKDKPFLIQKSDGAYLYATTDLAALRFRVAKWKADRILYVTDGRQQLHFHQLAATAKRWGLSVRIEHVWFGSILGEDKKPLKTREGRPIKLRELLSEAERRAYAIIAAKRPDLPEERKIRIARAIGIGALKYADLSQNRNLDYVFRWEKLLSFEGNTAPYLLNAYVRIRAILRKAEASGVSPAAGPLAAPAEVQLTKLLLDFSSILARVQSENRPHFLCTYLYEVARSFHRFYESCPVLTAPPPMQAARILLCQGTAATLGTGLDLLGIERLEEM